MIFRSTSSRLVERRLRRASDSLKSKNAELLIILEQFEALSDDADEKEVRALVSETPLAAHEHRESSRHREALRSFIADLKAEIAELELEQDRLLDQLRK